jgi:hypothetical protein
MRPVKFGDLHKKNSRQSLTYFVGCEINIGNKESKKKVFSKNKRVVLIVIMPLHLVNLTHNNP